MNHNEEENSDNDFTDVIIIGAGLSGLTAALILHEKEPSLTCLVLEAKNEIGGRTLSTGRHIYNATGSFINSNQKQLVEISNRFDIKLEQIRDDSHKSCVIYNGKSYKTKLHNITEFCNNPLDKIDLMKFVKKIEDLCKQHQVNDEIAKINMEQYINANIISKTARDIMKFLILIHCGVFAQQISVGFYVFFCTSTHGILSQLNNPGGGFKHFSIKNGVQEICQQIAQLLPNIILNETVVKIIVKKHQPIAVETRKKSTYYANNIILAIPPSANLDITFKPPLPGEKIDAISNIIKGNLGRFIISYSNNFWRVNSSDFYFLNGHNSENPILCCFETKSQAILSGYYLDFRSKDIKSDILGQLSRFLGSEAINPLEIITENYNSGSPMNIFNSLSDFLQYRNNHGRIYWAGAETSHEWYGCLEGAVIAGKAAAFEALYDLRPGALSLDDFHFITDSLTATRRRHINYSNIYKKALNWKFSIPFSLLVLFLIYKMWRRGVFERIASKISRR